MSQTHWVDIELIDGLDDRTPDELAKLATALRLLTQKGGPVVGVTDAQHRPVGLLIVENFGKMMMVAAVSPLPSSSPTS